MILAVAEALGNSKINAEFPYFYLRIANEWSIFIQIFDRDTYPMILVANKVDLVHLRKITEEQGRELAATLKVSLVRCSRLNTL